jgi:hypothetical protein
MNIKETGCDNSDKIDLVKYTGKVVRDIKGIENNRRKVLSYGI